MLMKTICVEYKDGSTKEFKYESGYISNQYNDDQRKHPTLVLKRNGKYEERINLDKIEMVHFFATF